LLASDYWFAGLRLLVCWLQTFLIIIQNYFAHTKQ
jgi:hypothetical protein